MRLNSSAQSSPCPNLKDDRPAHIEEPIPVIKPAQDELSPNAEVRLQGVVLNAASLLESRMLPYLRMVVSLIEGIEFSQQEMLQLLQQALRQHSIARRMRCEYVLRFLHDHPP